MASSSAKDTFIRAQKKEKGWYPFDKTMRLEDASELYVKAANLFRIEKNQEEAAKSFESAAKCCEAIDNKFYAAAHYIDAANCLKSTDQGKAIELMNRARDLYSQEGRFQTTAKITKDIAELMEKNGKFDQFHPDPEYFKLVQLEYSKASELFQAENNKSSALMCIKKISHIHILLGEFLQAATVNETMAKEALDGDTLLKYQAKEHLFLAGLCFIAANDSVGSEKALERFMQLSPQFAISREFTFLKNLLKLSETKDFEGIATLVREYDSISALDQEKVSLLLKIKIMSTPPNRLNLDENQNDKLNEDDGLA